MPQQTVSPAWARQGAVKNLIEIEFYLGNNAIPVSHKKKIRQNTKIASKEDMHLHTVDASKKDKQNATKDLYIKMT